MDNYDIVVIGSGAGGGTLTHALASTGKRILLIERGDYLRREKQNWSSVEIWGKKRYRNSGPWHDANADKEFTPKQHYYVGGNTKFYGAILFRKRERDFGEVTHVDGISPAWPIDYADFEPYYMRAEQLYSVHGERAVDPFDPPASGPYPFPAVSDEPRIAELRADLARAGRQPFSLPVGIMLDEQRPETTACIRCDTCDGFPCLVNAKADTHVVCVEPALRYPNVTLLTNALVTQLETSANGREITDVVVERNGETERYRGDVIVLSAGAINSASLLLRSSSDRHAAGLANGSGMVGRNLMLHNNSSLIAFSKTPNPTKFQKTLGINDYYYGDGDWPYPLGAMQMLGKSDAFTVSLDDHRVTVRPDGQISLRYSPTNLSAHQRLVETFKGLLESMRCRDEVREHPQYLGGRLGLNGVAHQNGTVRFGNDPATSALDVNCKAHELDNLYVVDSSFFVSSSAVNPTLTIIANALRVADHLKERLT